MKNYLVATALALVACAENPPPEAVQPAPPTTALPPPAPAPEPQVAKPEPTPEEKKKAEDARQLGEERARWEKAHATETARWTPELRAEAKALADKSFPTGKAAVLASMQGKHRVPGAQDRDKYRHPVETLEFFGFRPNMTVLDIGPGEGWMTEIVAPVLSKKGKYLATGGDPHGPPDARGTFYAQRFKAFTDKSPEAYGKVETIVVDGKAPKLNRDGQVDLVLLMRGIHGMKNAGTFSAWLAEIHKTLKPQGVLGIEQHRAAPGANTDESAKKGYVPEAWVIETVEAAGFKLAAKSEINANPKDTKDYPDGVWTLPPTLRLGEQDKDKYMAIGESDRMTLKFVKVAPGKAPAGKVEPSKAPKTTPAKK